MPLQTFFEKKYLKTHGKREGENGGWAILGGRGAGGTEFFGRKIMSIVRRKARLIENENVKTQQTRPPTHPGNKKNEEPPHHKRLKPPTTNEDDQYG